MKKIGVLCFGICLLASNLVYAETSYDDGFVIGSKKEGAFFKINGRGKTRLSYSYAKKSFPLSLPEMRLKLSGEIFGGKLGYLAEIDFAEFMPKASGKFEPSSVLKDFYFNYSALDGDLQFKLGYFKQSLYRSYLTSSGNLALIDRVFFLSNDNFKEFASRKAGLSVHNGRGSEFEWNVDVLTSGIAGRFAYNSKEFDGYNEFDFLGRDSFRWGVSLSGNLKVKGLLEDESLAGLAVNRGALGLDFMMKWAGLSWTVAGYMVTSFPVDVAAFNGASYTQLSYMLLDDLAISARYALTAVATGIQTQNLMLDVALFCLNKQAKIQLGGGVSRDKRGVWSPLAQLQAQFEF